ncbi:MAG: hypothetical protein HY006_01755 [Candidatus Sungbacteria bacterium]|nr:hypothetical protein [Candidatus Sungbacteria bacterium]
MSVYTERFGFSSVETAVARVIMATEIYRDSRDMLVRAARIRKFRHDPDAFSTIAELIRQTREKYDTILALLGTPEEWEQRTCENPQTLIANATMAIVETYGGTWSNLLFRVRDARSLSSVKTEDLTARQQDLLVNFCSYI